MNVSLLDYHLKFDAPNLSDTCGRSHSKSVGHHQEKRKPELHKVQNEINLQWQSQDLLCWGTRTFWRLEHNVRRILCEPGLPTPLSVISDPDCHFSHRHSDRLGTCIKLHWWQQSPQSRNMKLVSLFEVDLIPRNRCTHTLCATCKFQSGTSHEATFLRYTGRCTRDQVHRSSMGKNSQWCRAKVYFVALSVCGSTCANSPWARVKQILAGETSFKGTDEPTKLRLPKPWSLLWPNWLLMKQPFILCVVCTNLEYPPPEIDLSHGWQSTWIRACLVQSAWLLLKNIPAEGASNPERFSKFSMHQTRKYSHTKLWKKIKNFKTFPELEGTARPCWIIGSTDPFDSWNLQLDCQILNIRWCCVFGSWTKPHRNLPYEKRHWHCDLVWIHECAKWVTMGSFSNILPTLHHARTLYVKQKEGKRDNCVGRRFHIFLLSCPFLFSWEKLCLILGSLPIPVQNRSWPTTPPPPTPVYAWALSPVVLTNSLIWHHALPPLWAVLCYSQLLLVSASCHLCHESRNKKINSSKTF